MESFKNYSIFPSNKALKAHKDENFFVFVAKPLHLDGDDEIDQAMEAIEKLEKSTEKKLKASEARMTDRIEEVKRSVEESTRSLMQMNERMMQMLSASKKEE